MKRRDFLSALGLSAAAVVVGSIEGGGRQSTSLPGSYPVGGNAVTSRSPSDLDSQPTTAHGRWFRSRGLHIRAKVWRQRIAHILPRRGGTIHLQEFGGKVFAVVEDGTQRRLHRWVGSTPATREIDPNWQGWAECSAWEV